MNTKPAIHSMAATKLIDLKTIWQHPLGRRLATLFETPLERTLAIDTLNGFYDVFQRLAKEQRFFPKALQAMDVSYTLSDADRAKIPAKGPLVVVANHPFGGVEGVILGDLLESVRPDVKVMGNFLLNTIPEMRPYLISVDNFGHKASIAANAAAYKKCIRHLSGGGVLIVFPAGEVAHFHLRQRKVTDSPWSPHVGRMIQRTRAPRIAYLFPGL